MSDNTLGRRDVLTASGQLDELLQELVLSVVAHVKTIIFGPLSSAVRARSLATVSRKYAT